jgi:polyhydroxybutyrate depolymerase
MTACGSGEDAKSNPSSDSGGAGDRSLRADTGDRDATFADVRHDANPRRGEPDGQSQVDAGPVGGSRPVTVHVPPSYAKGTALPLLIMLHGYGASGAIEEAYLQLTPLADSLGFLYAYPDGTVDSDGKRFWNATNACCDYGTPKVDDSTYLSDLVTEIGVQYSVDPKRVFFLGHSNGGFMAYRMACDHSDQIAAIVSLAGAMWEDTTQCPASDPVSVLEIHGTADTVILYDGGALVGAPYPGAQTTVSDWVAFDGCETLANTSSPNLDLDAVLPGTETTVTKYGQGCKPGGHAELWSIVGGSHIPTLSGQFAPDAVGYLLAHPKP